MQLAIRRSDYLLYHDGLDIFVILNQTQLAGMNSPKAATPITVRLRLLLHTLIPIALDECA